MDNKEEEKNGTVSKLPRSGRPSKIPPRAYSEDSSRKSQRPKDSTVGTADLSCISQGNTVHDSAVWKTLKHENDIHAIVVRWTLTQKNFNARLNFAKTYLDNPQTSGECFVDWCIESETAWKTITSLITVDSRDSAVLVLL